MDIPVKKYEQSSDLEITSKLSKYSLANLFNVVQLGENSYFNISKTILFENINDIPASYYTVYEMKETDTWTGLSYRYFGTIKLWWLICKFNNITNPLMVKSEGLVLKIPNKDLVEQILRLLKTE
jgi:hypothetical protein